MKMASSKATWNKAKARSTFFELFFLNMVFPPAGRPPPEIQNSIKGGANANVETSESPPAPWGNQSL
jgi:hypothetical protein